MDYKYLDTKRQEVGMNKIKLEVMSFKYLLKNVIYAIYDLNLKVDRLLEKEGLVRPQPTVEELLDKTNDIWFDMFRLTKPQYQKLIEEYGLDLTTQCCVALDDFIRDKGYVPYGRPYNAIKRVIALNIMRDKEPPAYEDTQIFEPIPYEEVDTLDKAKKYIMSIPKYKRNITKEVIELIERFNITTLNLKEKP